MSEKFEYKSQHGDVEEVEITLDFYLDNNNLYLGMESYDKEFGFMDHYGDITVNTIDLPYLHSAVDTNMFNDHIVTFLEENDFAKDTGQVVRSGYCIYPVMKFSEETLKRVCPEEFKQYQKAHGREPLEDLAKEAKERAAEKNAALFEQTKDRKSPEL